MPLNPVHAAQQKASAGHVRDAVALLGAAGDKGDAPALAELATWHLVGDVIPRDLAAARALLRRAVAIGHVDAALLEITLTANGAGGRADWQGAVKLLEIAADNDPVAAQQLALLGAMDLNADGSPGRLPRSEQIGNGPAVQRFAKLFSADECRHIALVCQDILAPAVVADPATGRHIVHPVRTSDGAVIGPARENLVVRALNRRIAAISKTGIDQGEPLSVLRYAPGQEYRPHFDGLSGVQNQRIKTVLVYLNHGFGGGETRFIANGLMVEPRAGDAILFDNVTTNGAIDKQSQHAGLPVTHGVKWLATRWIRERSYNPWTDFGT